MLDLEDCLVEKLTEDKRLINEVSQWYSRALLRRSDPNLSPNLHTLGLHAVRRVGVPLHRTIGSVLRAAARFHPGRLSTLLWRYPLWL